ncbi:iron complex transport system permease protein [Mesocricetibacter intestinalis]|uniref:Iron complex transport system permease protein n=1 Tax=Mesocricetibacter intestinalis TaxID=1521930 RepID=A0A4R6V6H3_9PAST|nr:Fe(3+)-hydroxamate ABC transporter permease FhuB [Mesocricetibacter intestinalis]TDQ56317.1 iron complex transport system permease protein [Mesocricetibacter intestinalis]
MKKRGRVICLFMLFVLLSVWLRIHLRWPADWSLLLKDPDHLSLQLAAAQIALLPQMAVALLAGGMLGLISIALQQIVHNSLASDSTLAVAGGAQLALMLATLFFPAAGLFGSFAVAFSGALLAVVLALFIAGASKMDPLMLILGGLILNILFGAVAGLILIFYTDILQGVMIWGGGSLVQDGWSTAKTLLIPTALFLLLLFLLQRPLTMMSLDDRQAQRLGLPVKRIRYVILIACAGATAWVVSKIGVIAFIGLAAASVVNVLHIRSMALRFVIAFGAGASLLLMTDNLLAITEHYTHWHLPTGSLTAVLGAPLIIWLVLRQRKQTNVLLHEGSRHALIKPADNRRLFWILAALLILGFVLMQVYVKGIHGWHWSFDFALIEVHRYPRSLSAAATGAMLAAGGVLLQTLTRNPMASPEVLGISSGASLAVIGTFLFFPSTNALLMLAAGTLGSLAVLGTILWLSRYLSPANLLLTGIAIGALANAVLTLLQMSGNPYLQMAITWLSGTTYNARPDTAWWLFVLSLVLCLAALLSLKPLKLLGLGENVARNLGLNVRRSEGLLLLLVALMSTGATLAVGPLSFIGLMTPHIARSMGAISIEKQLPTAIMLGILLMLIADWLGRYLIFPYEIPAGTLCALVGGIYFIWKIQKNPMA